MTTERTPAQTDDLIRALGRQMNEARDALNELVEAAAESGEYEDDDPDPDENTLASLKNRGRTSGSANTRVFSPVAVSRDG